MKLSIEIDSENDDCSTRQNLIRILETLLPKLYTADSERSNTIFDINGNNVGTFSISDEDEYDEGLEGFDDDENEFDELED